MVTHTQSPIACVSCIAWSGLGRESDCNEQTEVLQLKPRSPVLPQLAAITYYILHSACTIDKASNVLYLCTQYYGSAYISRCTYCTVSPDEKYQQNDPQNTPQNVHVVRNATDSGLSLQEGSTNSSSKHGSTPISFRVDNGYELAISGRGVCIRDYSRG